MANFDENGAQDMIGYAGSYVKCLYSVIICDVW